MMKKLATFLMTMILLVASISALSACSEEARMPLRQGSNVFYIAGEPVAEQEVNIFEDYDSFKNSEYSDMRLGSCNVEAKKSYYTKDYFKEHNLILAKVNIDKNATAFMKSIVKNSNTYMIDLINIVKEKSDKTKLALLAIETDKTPLVDANIVVNMTTEEKLTGLPDLGEYSNAAMLYCSSNSSNTKPVEVSKYTSKSELDKYKVTANDVTQNVCNTFDVAFFEENYILAIDYRTNSVNTMESITISNGIVKINTYSSDHYVYVDEKERIVKLIPMPKNIDVSKIVMTEYVNNDIGENVAPIITTIEQP